MSHITFASHRLKTLCEEALPNIAAAIETKMNTNDDEEVRVSASDDLRALNVVNNLLAEAGQRNLITITHDEWRVLIAFKETAEG